jgi:hypothetical protein
MTGEPNHLPSLLALTLRRALVAGKLYFGLGTGIGVLLSLILLRASSAAFSTTFPLELPLFAILGSTGGIMLFASDRSKGVLEYLIAYGVQPWTLFLNVVLVTIMLASIVVVVPLAVGLAGFLATKHVVTMDLENSLLLYTLPMSYAGAVFATVCGMIWSALSTPRMSMNSPVGIAPMLGAGPTVLVIYAAELMPRSDYYYITAGASAALVIAVLTTLALATRLMSRERYLSPM